VSFVRAFMAEFDRLFPPPEKVVHVLVHGYPLCAFDLSHPSRWPEGHSWVSYYDVVKATCRQCLAKWEEGKS
jgi:hypothetical protein